MIFISYSWRDRAVVELLVHPLQSSGVPYWLDSENVCTRKPILPQLTVGLQRSTVVLFIDSAHSRRSPWVWIELAFARHLGVRTIALAAARGPRLIKSVSEIDGVDHRVGRLYELEARDLQLDCRGPSLRQVGAHPRWYQVRAGTEGPVALTEPVEGSARGSSC